MSNHIHFSYTAQPYCINHLVMVPAGVVSINLYRIPMVCEGTAEAPQQFKTH